MEKIKIKLTKDEYGKLLDILYISDWVLNSCRLGQRSDRFLKEFFQLEQTLLAMANGFGFDSYVQWDEATQQYLLTTTFDQVMEEENGAFQYIDEFEEYIFWDSLCERLARRDIEKEIGCEKFLALNPFERYRMLEDLMEKYHKEFALNGLANLHIDNDNK